MRIRSILGCTLCTLVVLMSFAGTGLALANPLTFVHVPEDPTAVLVALGGAGLAWQYLRSRVRK
jgi:hypothetical protein